jgi:hypothetical protein
VDHPADLIVPAYTGKRRCLGFPPIPFIIVLFALVYTDPIH